MASHLQLTQETATPPPTRAQIRAIEKEKRTAEMMAPRLCKLPRCRVSFVPKRVQDWKSEFCCKEHQAAFWVEANRVSAEILAQNAPSPILPASQFKPGVSHRQQVLDILERNVNQWVEHPRELLPGVVWSWAVAKLRYEGHKIERRTIGETPYELVGGMVRHQDKKFIPQRNWRKYLTGGKVEYQYMLVRPVK